MKRWLGVVVAGLAGLPLPRLLGLGSEDPLAGTMAILPLVAAALWALEEEALEGGARRPRHRWRTDLLLLAGWSIMVAARTEAGLDHAAAVLAALLFCWLGVRVAALLIAWRPLMGGDPPQRPSLLFFLLPLVVYVAVMPWCTGQRQPDGDEPYFLLITHSLAFDGDLDLTDNYARQDARRFVDRPIEPQPGDPVGRNGRQYSRHAPMLPLVLAPFYRLAGLPGAHFTIALLTALLAWWTLRLARHLNLRPGTALIAYATLSFLPPLLFYSHQIWAEVPAALLAVVALDLLAAGTGLGWALLPLLALPLLKLRFALVALPIAVWGWWRRGHRLGEAIVGLGALGALGVAVLIGNFARYGSALKVHSATDLAVPSPAPFLQALSGVFFDAAFGLFAVAPLWLLLIPALLSPRGPSRQTLGLLAVAAPSLVLIATRTEWYGGWSPPFRYGIVVLPIFALILAPLLEHRRAIGARFLLGSLGAATAGLALLWLTVPGWTYSLADGGNHLLDHLASRLDLDVLRFAPSSVRPRLATWLWPPLALVLLPLIWHRPRRRRAPATALGVGAAILLPGLLLAAAAIVPTRIIEAEDGHVEKDGGWLYPEQWTFNRGRFRGGWTLPEGGSLVAPVVPGGERVTITMHVRFDRLLPRPSGLRLFAGETLVRVWRPEGESGEWATVVAGPAPWPRETPLRLETSPLLRPGRRNTFVIDRLELDWE